MYMFKFLKPQSNAYYILYLLIFLELYEFQARCRAGCVRDEL